VILLPDTVALEADLSSMPISASVQLTLVISKYFVVLLTETHAPTAPASMLQPVMMNGSAAVPAAPGLETPFADVNALSPLIEIGKCAAACAAADTNNSAAANKHPIFFLVIAIPNPCSRCSRAE